MTLTPQTDLALDFLHRWSSSPWILTAINPNDGKIKTRGFRESSEMRDWISAYNGNHNLYFTINPVREVMDKKPSRADIASITAFQVDCDPRVGEDLGSERIRIINNLCNFTPHPSIICDSGSGYQAFWLLQEPIILDGTEECAIQAESYSLQLEILLGGDRTSNADRIFRIPGTINLPNEVKKKKGRVASLASLVEWAGTRYPLSAFTKAPIKIQAPVKIGALELTGGERIKLGSIQPLYIEDLEKKGIALPEPIKELILSGHQDSKYPSRSEALWAVVCALARTPADDDTIAGIIMNRDNKISASVLDKPRPERYAIKQIQDAREEVYDPNLRELNSKHAVISDIGGKCRIISEVYDEGLKRTRISYQSFSDFMNRYCNRKVQVATTKDNQPVYHPLGKWWVGHEKRRQYDTVIFSPGQEVTTAYNLWKGFACDAIPGNCGLFTEHILLNICQNNNEYYEYLLSWMARCVQKPDCPGEVAVILRGEMGTGKSFFAKNFGALFGRHFLQVSDSKHLIGNFNSHLQDCIVLFGDEAFYAGDKKHESVLRALVTEETLSLEAKGVDMVASSNYTHIILGSNSQWVVPAGNNERRYFVLDVGNDKMQNKKYFAGIKKQLSSGGLEALLYLLLNRDISNFEVRDVPKTIALQDQKILSMSPEEIWWYEKLEEGHVLKKQDGWEHEILKEELQNDYINYMIRTGNMRKASATILGRFLFRVCPKGTLRSFQKMATVREQGNYGEEYTVTREAYFYGFPELAICRDYWDSRYGGPFKWGIPLKKSKQEEFLK
jgi:hypothetical protein